MTRFLMGWPALSTFLLMVVLLWLLRLVYNLRQLGDVRILTATQPTAQMSYTGSTRERAQRVELCQRKRQIPVRSRKHLEQER